MSLSDMACYFGHLAWTFRHFASGTTRDRETNAVICARNLGLPDCPRTLFGEPVRPGAA